MHATRREAFGPFDRHQVADPRGAQYRGGFSKRHPMLDVILVLGAVAFFAASVAYGYACDRM